MSRSHKRGGLSQNRNRRQQTGTSKNLQSAVGLEDLQALCRRSAENGWLIMAVLVAAVFLAYQPAWNGEFIWDDDLHLLNNPVLKTGGFFQTWIPGSYISYWPLTFSVYRLEYELWGLHPFGFHVVNIALHTVAALLVWRILTLLRIPGALFAAAIFALHPVNVESVAWITQTKNTLSLMLMLLALLFYLLHERDGGRRLYAMSVGIFFLSTLAKGMGLTLPVVMLACVWWQRGKLGRRDFLRILPYVLIAALMVGIELFTQHLGAGQSPVRSDSFLTRAAIAGCAVWFYFWKFLWPTDLMFVYPRWNIDARDLLAYLPGLMLAVIFVAAWFRRRSWGRPVLFFMICYLTLLLPTLGFVNIIFMEYSLVADHWQYAAMIVPCAALAAALAASVRRLPAPRFVGWVASISVLLSFAVLTFRQSRMYADVETLYRTTLEQNPACWLAHNNLGILLEAQYKPGEATTHYEKALESKPDYLPARCNLGIVLARQGNIEEAISQFQEALRVDENCVDAHSNLARALARQGNVEEAINHYRDALKIEPNAPTILNDFAWLRATRAHAIFRDGAEAVKMAERASELTEGKSAKILDTLAAAYAEAGRFPEAVETARKAVNLAFEQKQEIPAKRMEARLQLYESKIPCRD